jgi:hypothetical protein
MKYKNISLILLSLPVLLLSSCKTSSSEIDYNPNVLSAKDYIRAEDELMEVVNSFYKGIHDTLVLNNSYGYIDACDVSYIPSQNTIKFSYGTINRMCQDDKFRRGVFTAVFNGEVFQEGVTATLVTDSLFVDDYLFEATMEIKYNGLNGRLIPEYSLKVDTSLIMLPDTNKVNGVSLKTDFLLTWEEGFATPAVHEDDLYEITGTASGVSTNGYIFSTSVTEPLFNYLDCFWIAQGINSITVATAAFPTGTIDYITGDGCNNEFFFYFNDNKFYDLIK